MSLLTNSGYCYAHVRCVHRALPEATRKGSRAVRCCIDMIDQKKLAPPISNQAGPWVVEATERGANSGCIRQAINEAAFGWFRGGVKNSTLMRG